MRFLSDGRTRGVIGRAWPGSGRVGDPGSGAVDWPMFHNTLDRDGWNTSEHILSPTTVGGLTQKWVAPTGDIVFSSAAVVNGVVYVGSFDDKLYALDAATGGVHWTTATSG